MLYAILANLFLFMVFGLKTLSFVLKGIMIFGPVNKILIKIVRFIAILMLIRRLFVINDS